MTNAEAVSFSSLVVPADAGVDTFKGGDHKLLDINGLLRVLEGNPSYNGQIVSWRVTPAQPGRYTAPEQPLPARLAARLSSLGITSLYEHQTAALEAVRRGQNVVVETPTASGKSLCFHLPVLEGLAADPDARALYLFPTKALARDQLGKLGTLADGATPMGVYDGDTPRNERRRLREEARLLLTNPDLLHLGILPYHLQWGAFFANLRYVVVDEIHTYRGVFGTHVAHTLRRLRRVAAAHGGNPRFIAASATIANPAAHAEALFGAPVNLIRGNGAPRGERAFVLWDAYRRQRSKLGLTQTAYLEDATWLLAALLGQGVRTIVFTLARQVTEWLLVYLARHLEAIGQASLAGKVRAYRGGYLPSERRAIERQLFDGDLLGVVSTSALELGVDIGGLEAAVLVGYPGTMASLWQQAGRAGRGGEPSLGIFIPGPNLLERYLLGHPDYFFGRPFEQVSIDPANLYILVDHLSAAAFEWPLSRADEALWGESALSLAELLASEGRLTENKREGRWYYAGEGYPASRVSLRGSSGQIRLVAGGETIGTIDAAGAHNQVHPGAVYLHGGETYLVSSLDLEGNFALLERTGVDYYTEATETTEVLVVEEHDRRDLGQCTARLGEVRVTTQVTGYRRRQTGTGALVGAYPLQLPPRAIDTVAFWLAFARPPIEALAGRGLDAAGGLHGLEHLLIGLMPLLVLCDRWDVGGSSTLFHPDTGGPCIFVYDAAAGGMGFAERAYNGLPEFIARAAEALAACPCAHGCPSCIQSPKCGNHNQPLDKRATKEILARVTNQNEGH
ncbi:MAG: DEAD/DEAH box helicase [Bacteroidota bacterium]